MAYFDDWFGDGDDYLLDWFDPSEAITPSVPPGTTRSKVVFLGTKNPRPQVPPHRYIEGPAGMMLQEIRRFLNEAVDRPQNWGNHVQVTFPGAGTTIRVDTGLGGPATGYKVVRKSAAIDVYDGVTPASDDEKRGVLYLQATGAGTVTLYVY